MIDACAKLSERHAFVAHRDFPAEVCKRCGIEHALSGQALLHSGIAGRRRREDDFGFFDPPHALRQHRVDTAGRKLRELGKEKVFPAAALNPARLIEVRTEFSKKRVIRRQKLQGLTNNAVGACASRTPFSAIPVSERERFTLARTLPRGKTERELQCAVFEYARQEELGRKRRAGDGECEKARQNVFQVRQRCGIGSKTLAGERTAHAAPDEVTRYLPVSLGRMPHERSNEERERKINARIGRVGVIAEAGKGSALRCERLQGEERSD